MEILKFTGNPLVRQTTEAHLITKQSLKGIALNRKGEWGQNLAPKLILDGQEPPQRKSGKLRGGREEGKEGGKEEREREGQGEEGGKAGEVESEGQVEERGEGREKVNKSLTETVTLTPTETLTFTHPHTHAQSLAYLKHNDKPQPKSSQVKQKLVFQSDTCTDEPKSILPGPQLSTLKITRQNSPPSPVSQDKNVESRKVMGGGKNYMGKIMGIKIGPWGSLECP